MFISFLWGQSEHDILQYQKQKVKMILNLNLAGGDDLHNFSFEYTDNQVIQFYPSNFWDAKHDTIFTSQNRIDSIYHIYSKIPQIWDSLYKKTYFLYDNNLLVEEKIIEENDKLIKKYIYNKSGYLDTLIAYKINKNKPEFIYSYKCDKKGRILSKELIRGEGINKLQKATFIYNKRGKIIQKTEEYYDLVFFSSDHEYKEGDKSRIRYQYKYNRKGLIKTEYEAWDIMRLDNRVVEGILFPNNFGYEYYD